MRSQLLLAALITMHGLTGCSQSNKKLDQAPVPVSPDAKYSMHELDELLRFIGELAGQTAEQRAAECSHVLELNQSGPNVGLWAHLFLAQLLVESCGEIRETATALQARKSEIKDERVRHFLAYQDQMLARLDREVEKRKSLYLNLKFTEQQARKRKRELITFESEVKNCESELSSCENDLLRRESQVKNLQDKLDALKSIEENVGGSQGH